MNNYIDKLAQTHLFTNRDIESIKEKPDLEPSLMHYEKNSIVHLAGDECKGLEIIVKGSALVQNIDESGNVLTVKDLVVGEIMSANLLFSSSPYYPMSVFAKSDLLVLSFTKHQVLEFCSNMQFLENLLQSLADKTATLSGIIRVLNQKSLREQIIDFLIAQYKIQEQFKIKLSTSKKELANRFGVRRSSLSRELNKMRSDGLVVYDSKSITIVDKKMITIS